MSWSINNMLQAVMVSNLLSKGAFWFILNLPLDIREWLKKPSPWSTKMSQVTFGHDLLPRYNSALPTHETLHWTWPAGMDGRNTQGEQQCQPVSSFKNGIAPASVTGLPEVSAQLVLKKCYRVWCKVWWRRKVKNLLFTIRITMLMVWLPLSLPSHKDKEYTKIIPEHLFPQVLD